MCVIHRAVPTVLHTHINTVDFNCVAIGNYSPEYSTIAFSRDSVIVVMNISIVPDVNLNGSGELIGVSTVKIPKGSVGPCLIPLVDISVL